MKCMKMIAKLGSSVLSLAVLCMKASVGHSGYVISGSAVFGILVFAGLEVLQIVYVGIRVGDSSLDDVEKFERYYDQILPEIAGIFLILMIVARFVCLLSSCWMQTS